MEYNFIYSYFSTNNARREPVQRQQTRRPQKSVVPETEFDEKETWNWSQELKRIFEYIWLWAIVT